MADATNEVRELWWCEDEQDWKDHTCSCGEPLTPHTQGGDDLIPYIARPRADDDARERLLDALVKDRGEWKARAEKAERERDEALERLGALILNSNKWKRERDEARALLREARGFLDHRAGTFGLPRLVDRIDAHFDAPTPDDRKGEDGAWCAQ